MAIDQNIFERSYNWVKYKVDTNVRGQMADTTNEVGDVIGKGLKMEEPSIKSLKEALPVAAGVAVGATGLLFADKISNATKGIFQGIGTVVTGFGTFEKIPVLGSLTTGLASLIEGAGNFAGHGVAIAAGFLTHTLTRAKPYKPDPTANTADQGTGADPEKAESEIVKLFDKDAEIPKGPKKHTPDPDAIAATGDSPDHVPYETLRDKRIAAINAKDTKYIEAYRILMRDANQSFENRAQFLREARTFEASPDRKDYIDRLLKVGLNENESNRLTVFAPRFVNSIHDNPDNFNLPPDLEALGRDFDATYGGGCWPLEGRATGTYKFADLPVTQKVDHIQQSLAYMDQQMDFYFKHCIQTKVQTGGETGGVSKSESWDFKDRSDGPYIISRPKNERYTDPAQTPGNKKMLCKEEHNFMTRYYQVEYPDVVTIESSESLIRKGEGLTAEKDGFGQHQKKLNGYKEILRIAETNAKGEIALYKGRFKLMQESYKLLETHAGLAIIEARPLAGDRVELEVKDIRRFNPTAPNMAHTQKWTWRGKQSGDIFTITEVYDEFGHKVAMKSMDVNVKTGAGVNELLSVTDAYSMKTPMEKSKGEALYKDLNERFEVGPIKQNTTPSPSQPKSLDGNAPTFYTVFDRQTGIQVNIIGHNDKDAFTITGYQHVGKPSEARSDQYVVFKTEEFRQRTSYSNKEQLRAFMEEVAAKQNPRYRFEFKPMVENTKPEKKQTDPADPATDKISAEDSKHFYVVNDKQLGKTIAVHGKYENGTSGRFIATGYWIGSKEGDTNGVYKKFTNNRALNLENMSQQEHLLKHIIAREDTTQRYDMGAITKNTPSKAQAESKIWTAEELKNLHTQHVYDKYTNQKVNLHGTYDEHKKLFTVEAYEVITTPNQPGKYEKLTPPHRIDIKQQQYYDSLMETIAENRNHKYAKATPSKDEPQPEQALIAIADGSDVKPLPTAPLHGDKQPRQQPDFT